MKRQLIERLNDGPVICAEGFLFEVEKRGYLAAGEFVPMVALEHPEALENLHKDFQHAGSDIVQAFTYNGHREKMRVIDKEELLEPLNRAALKIAKKIADNAVMLAGESTTSQGYTEVRHMGASVVSMLNNALDAFARFDVDAAMRTIDEDKKIDLDYTTALRELATYMMEDPRSISRVINILWVVRSLERIGDHSKNLCEQIVFVVKGKDIRHQ